ncbi:MAG TPA: ribonuclease P protein component [Acholeplasma sp.]|jgi:ribonuclease P protein component
MKREYSIKSQQEFDRIFSLKTSFGNKEFSVYVAPHDGTHFKYGLSIGRKFGIAVKRNQAKRRIRAILTEYKQQIDPKKAFIIVIKPKVKDMLYKEIKISLTNLLIKAKLFKEEE